MADNEDDDWGNDWIDDDDGDKKQASKAAAAFEERKPVLPFVVLDSGQIAVHLRTLALEISDVLGVSVGDAGILLREYRWKKSKLVDDWVANSEKVRKLAGLKKNPALTRTSLSTSSVTDVTLSCMICTDTVPYQGSYSMSCGHRFCTSCWKNWVGAEMEKGPTVLYSKCPEHKCGETLPEDIFELFLSKSNYDRYVQFNIQSFVLGSTQLKFCPGTGCGRAIECNLSTGSKDVSCLCGCRFCFCCVQVAHRPVPCDLVKKWLEKNASDSENANWIMANTKVCPKCKVSIEKNQGCNHMQCKMCKHEFCWLCKGDWTEHGTATGGYYQCNKFEAKKDTDDEQKSVDKAANSLQRYLHYYTRFDNHAKAGKFAENAKMKTDVRMKELQDMRGAGFMDVQFLLNAVNTVISCRYVLQWTYAYGFYLQDGTPQKALFETFQEQLEKFTEHLHELSEKPLDSLKEIKLRTDVINYTRVTEKFRDNIIRAIESNFSES